MKSTFLVPYNYIFKQNVSIHLNDHIFAFRTDGKERSFESIPLGLLLLVVAAAAWAHPTHTIAGMTHEELLHNRPGRFFWIVF